MRETLQFSISGEYITGLVRTWFWDEHRPFDKCLELIGSCVQGPKEIIREITIAILEGRKAFTGINELEYVDDNRDIRPLTDRLSELETDLGIAKVKEDMQAGFIRYVDPWATIKSCHPSVLADNGNPTSYQDCIAWFAMDEGTRFRGPKPLFAGGEPILETPTMGGLWLIRYPDLTWRACGGELSDVGKPAFWRAVYEAVKDNPDFKVRNDRYRFSLRPKQAFSAPEGEIPKDVPRYLTPEWFLYKYRETGSMEYVLTPDEGILWESLVSPKGDWYSCPFGCHNAKAYYLILSHPEWIGKTKETLADVGGLDLSTGLDFLVRAGWCACRSVAGVHIRFPDLPRQMTKAQALRILEAMDRHNVHLESGQLKEVYDYA